MLVSIIRLVLVFGICTVHDNVGLVLDEIAW